MMIDDDDDGWMLDIDQKIEDLPMQCADVWIMHTMRQYCTQSKKQPFPRTGRIHKGEWRT